MPKLGPVILLAAFGACQARSRDAQRGSGPPSVAEPALAPRTEAQRAPSDQAATRGGQIEMAAMDTRMRYAQARQTMVSEQLAARDIRDPRVLDAMGSVPRHEFVGAAYREFAYEDSALPIEEDQTISQPYIVALMTELAQIEPGEKVLEVGTGSGYQAAVLAALGARVYSIEIIEPLANSARAVLARLNYKVEVRHGDGYAGWPEQAPFDAILITAAAPALPEPLKQQLAIGGRLVIPVGEGDQELWVWTRTKTGFERRAIIPVRFVPMTGKAQRRGN